MIIALSFAIDRNSFSIFYKIVESISELYLVAHDSYGDIKNLIRSVGENLFIQKNYKKMFKAYSDKGMPKKRRDKVMISKWQKSPIDPHTSK